MVNNHIQPLLTYWDLKLKHRHIYGKFDQLNLHLLNHILHPIQIFFYCCFWY